MALLKVCQKSPVLIRKCNMKKSSIPPIRGDFKRVKDRDSLRYFLQKDKEHLHFIKTSSFLSIQGLIYRYEKALRYHEYFHVSTIKTPKAIT